MPTRTELALAACVGISDEDLAKRGEGAFLYNLNRKREYRKAGEKIYLQAVHMAAAMKHLQDELKKAKKAVAEANEKLITLEALDAPVPDVSEAANLLQQIAEASKQKTNPNQQQN